MNAFQNRIKNLQKSVQAAETGEFDAQTTLAIMDFLGLKQPTDADFLENKKTLQRFLEFRGNDVDGIMGSRTLSRLEMIFSKELPKIPPGASLIASKTSLDIIVEFEVSSKSVYQRKYSHPILPGEYSGITIGIGYDLGHVNEATFHEDWSDLISQEDFDTLKQALGKTKTAARAALHGKILEVDIPWETAIEVFYTRSLPIWARRCIKIYPGLEKLPPDVQGTMVSLVYNRGTSLSASDSRREMRNLQKHIADANLRAMAEEFRSMKRLWPNSAGLRRRRDKEAALIENATYVLKPADYVFI
ncbi:hypothetical protein [Algoriphagus halophytocola]|uniref:Pesticin C-terminal domain-containing protein n=1 Tax=Algoriphagus halophytocola TaxID=2991499 RepID=A0ABY6MIJ0_9BACT|nr:hypothetical protein [Algoriphagus sp. TR-M5]UZD23448.1 hypothetical protein OM944_02935 [Algoriphagus sp. TR-M5]